MPLVPLEQFYTEARDAVVAERRRVGETNLVPEQVEQVIRSYVYLGLKKAIQDWTYNMRQADQDAIINAVIRQTKNLYLFLPTYERTYTNLQLLEDLAAKGQVNPIIAKPRAAQEQYEAATTGPGTGVDVGTVLKKSIEDVFGVFKSGTDSILKGLGIPFGTQAVIGIIALLILLPIFMTYLPGRGRA